MNEEIRNEIEKAAEILGMPVDEVTDKFNDICSQNNLDTNEEPQLARGLFRQWFSGRKLAQQRTPASSDDGFFKSAVGFFISLDEARDMMAIQRDRIVADFHRDGDTTYNLGKVALFTETGDKYSGRMMRDGDEVVREFTKLPDNHVELDNGEYLVPLDSTEKYGTYVNKNYGKPLPKSEFRRAGVFIGQVDGNMGKYYFNYKGVNSVDFNPKTFEFVHFTCIVNSNDATKIHGVTDKTSASLVYNHEMNNGQIDTSDISIQDELMNHSEGNFSPLIDLDRYHTSVTTKAYADRFVFTDGSVTSINMNPTKNGNRILTLDDLNTDFDFDDDGWSGTTCWIPSHIDIDFGIGSNVIVVGRTSQSRDDEGNLQNVSINVTGLYVLKSRGGSPETIEFVEEDDTDWFFS